MDLPYGRSLHTAVNDVTRPVWSGLDVGSYDASIITEVIVSYEDEFVESVSLGRVLIGGTSWGLKIVKPIKRPLTIIWIGPSVPLRARRSRREGVPRWYIAFGYLCPLCMYEF